MTMLVRMVCAAGAPALIATAVDPGLTNVTPTHLPAGVLNTRNMDARPADIDGDGDLDLVIAVEFGANLALRNDGAGRFTRIEDALLPVVHDSEDIAAADFDGDGDIDLVFVSEDDRVNEYLLNDGTGRFRPADPQLPITDVSNAVLAVDLNGDGAPDLLVGNAGQNRLLLNDGAGGFTDATEARLPAASDRTQDLEVGDVDGDGDLDLIVGNEDDNRLLINTDGVFADETAERLPITPGAEETREADFGDIDGDGDLDLFFANVAFTPGRALQDRLLINDGTGRFTDVTASQLPKDAYHSVDGDFADLDRDGDLDLIVAYAFGGNYAVFRNDGAGRFTDASGDFLPRGIAGSGIDVEAADLNGDGRLDLYMTNFQGGDFLLFGPAAAGAPAGTDADDGRDGLANVAARTKNPSAADAGEG